MRRALAVLALVALLGVAIVAPLAAVQTPPRSMDSPQATRTVTSASVSEDSYDYRSTIDPRSVQLFDAAPAVDTFTIVVNAPVDGEVASHDADAGASAMLSDSVEPSLEPQASVQLSLTSADSVDADGGSPPPTHRFDAMDGGGSSPAETAASNGFALLVALSQDTLALLGLAPQPGVGPSPPLPGPDAGPSMAPAPRVALAASGDLPVEVPGWLAQAAWTVALAAFGLATLREAGLLVGLFSRFTSSDVLEHGRRARLYEAIRADPGVTFGRLMELTGLAHGAAQHHLRQLERHGVVRRAREGRSSHYYPAGPRFEPPAALAPARRVLLETLRESPGLTLHELAARQGHRPQSVWSHLDRLRRAGLVLCERRGHAFAWRVQA